MYAYLVTARARETPRTVPKKVSMFKLIVINAALYTCCALFLMRFIQLH